MKDFTRSNNFNLKLAYSICLSFQMKVIADNKDKKLKFSNLKKYYYRELILKNN